MAKQPKIAPTFKNEQLQEVPEPTPQVSFPPPMVELVVHDGGLEIQKVPTQQGELTLVRIHTPTLVVTVKLNDDGVQAFVEALRGSPATRLVLAAPGDVPNLRG